MRFRSANSKQARIVVEHSPTKMTFRFLSDRTFDASRSSARAWQAVSRAGVTMALLASLLPKRSKRIEGVCPDSWTSCSEMASGASSSGTRTSSASIAGFVTTIDDDDEGKAKVEWMGEEGKAEVGDSGESGRSVAQASSAGSRDTDAGDRRVLTCWFRGQTEKCQSENYSEIGSSRKHNPHG